MYNIKENLILFLKLLWSNNLCCGIIFSLNIKLNNHEFPTFRPSTNFCEKGEKYIVLYYQNYCFFIKRETFLVKK